MSGLDFNIVAVLVAAAAGFAVGGIWYAPFLFGPLWSRMSPLEEDQRGGSGTREYAVSVACTVVHALVLYLILLATDAMAVAPALWTAFLLWAGFTAAPSLSETVFSRRPLGVWLVDSTHRLAVTLVMGLILALLG
ncbi:MAG TPA: DUF1761 domain-containing protein [Gammaproteobacteria bacterium]